MCNKKFENRLTKTKVMSKNIFELGIFYRKIARRGIFSRKIFKILIFYPNCPKSASDVTENLPAIKTFIQAKNVARTESF